MINAIYAIIVIDDGEERLMGGFNDQAQTRALVTDDKNELPDLVKVARRDGRAFKVVMYTRREDITALASKDAKHDSARKQRSEVH